MNIAVLIAGMAAIMLATSNNDESGPGPAPRPPEPEDPHPDPLSEGDPFRGSPTNLIEMEVLTLTCKGCGKVVKEIALPHTVSNTTMLSYVDSDFIPAWKEHVKHEHFWRYLFIQHPKFEYTLVREWRKKDGHARLS